MKVQYYVKVFFLSFVLMAVGMMSINAQPRQRAWFADGYHGGVYGHYPLEWYTQFMMDQLEKHPKWRIGLEIEPETWDSVKVHTPEAYERWRQVVVGPQVEYTNPSYAQSYLYPIHGESIIRQFQYGMRKMWEHFPTMTFTTYSVEEPCFTSCLPQILAQLGFRHAVLKCPDTCWGGYMEAFGGELVNWIGPDGTSLLSVPRYECEALQEGTVWQTIAWKNTREFLRATREAGIRHPVGMCYQDAGWKNGPWLGRDTLSQYVLWTDYIDNVADHSTATDYRMTQEGVRVALVWGSQVMQRIGQQVRKAENQLLDAERLSTINYLLTGQRPDQANIDEAWRTLMLAQHHDSWIVPYNRLNGRGTWADNIALWTDESCRRAGEVVGSTGQRVNKSTSQQVNEPASVAYFNTTGKTRNEIVSFQKADGSVVDVPVIVPAFGYATFESTSLRGNESTGQRGNESTSGLVVGKDKATMENDLYKLVFDLKRGGVLVSLYDKQQQKEVVDERNTFGFGELRGYFERSGGFCSSTEQKADVEVLKNNAYVKQVAISGKIAGTSFVQTYTLKKGEPLIDVELLIDWKHNTRIGNHYKRKKGDPTAPFYNTKYMLNVFFPTTQKDARLWKNAPFDVCESRLDSTFFDRWTDIRHNIIHSWIDTYDGETGLALFTDHTTSYSYAKDYPLALTVQYSGQGLWGRDHKITEKTRIRYALMPHCGSWDEAGVSDCNERWNHPLVCTPDKGTGERSLLSLDGTGYQLSAFTMDADGSVLLRLFNADGDDQPHAIPLNLPVKEIETVDLLGRPMKDESARMQDGKLNVQMPRFGIRTYKMRLVP